MKSLFVVLLGHVAAVLTYYLVHVSSITRQEHNNLLRKQVEHQKQAQLQNNTFRFHNNIKI